MFSLEDCITEKAISQVMIIHTLVMEEKEGSVFISGHRIG